MTLLASLQHPIRFELVHFLHSCPGMAVHDELLMLRTYMASIDWADFNLPAYLLTYLSIYLSIYLSTYLHTYLPTHPLTHPTYIHA